METELVREGRICETKRYIYISQFVCVFEKGKTHAERSKHRSQLGGGSTRSNELQETRTRNELPFLESDIMLIYTFGNYCIKDERTKQFKKSLFGIYGSNKYLQKKLVILIRFRLIFFFHFRRNFLVCSNHIHFSSQFQENKMLPGCLGESRCKYV